MYDSIFVNLIQFGYILGKYINSRINKLFISLTWILHDLFQSKANIVTPRNGEPLIAAIQDFITGNHDVCSIKHKWYEFILIWFLVVTGSL